LNVRSETIKVEENISDKLFDTGLGNILDLTPKAKATKVKINKWGLHQTKKLLHSKGTHQQNEKITYRTGDNICKSYTLRS